MSRWVEGNLATWKENPSKCTSLLFVEGRVCKSVLFPASLFAENYLTVQRAQGRAYKLFAGKEKAPWVGVSASSLTLGSEKSFPNSPQPVCPAGWFQDLAIGMFCLSAGGRNFSFWKELHQDESQKGMKGMSWHEDKSIPTVSCDLGVPVS